jgi:nicotinamidase/pyrazinamidase
MKKNLLESYDRVVAINVDPQNDFINGSLPVPEGADVISPLNDINEYVRERGGDVIITGDQHPAETPHFDTWVVHCVAGTVGAAFHPDLVVKASDVIIDKGTGQTDGYSGFDGATKDGATIEQILRPRNPRERVAAILGGLATDYCVKATGLDASELATEVALAKQGVLDVFLAVDAIRAVNIQPEDGEMALDDMESAGVKLVTTAELIG